MMIELHTEDELSKVICILGGFIIFYGLVSYLIKERLYLSEALVSTIVGIILGPIALHILDPGKWGYKSEITHGFTRVVLAIQVMFSSVALPRAYPIKEFKSLLILLFPVMIFSWVINGLLMWWIIPHLTFLGSLALAACITPTDPILSSSVVKGKFAEKHVPPHIRNLLSAESAANDGCAGPFLSFAFYLMESEFVGPAIGNWILISWLYEIGVAIVVGIILGYVARKLLYFSEKNRLIDKESFLVFAIALALFVMGFVSIIGCNDFIACFAAGNSFTWDDWFRQETEEAHLQEVIDMLLNLAIFIYIGSIIEWRSFNLQIPIWKLFLLSLSVLSLKRLPVVFLSSKLKLIPAVKTYREALFTGWFGPIGVGAIYYLTIVNKKTNDAALLEISQPVIFFLVLSSILVHGITVPLIKISKRINTRTITISSINNQVSRLQIIKFGQDIVLDKRSKKANGDANNEGEDSKKEDNQEGNQEDNQEGGRVKIDITNLEDRNSQEIDIIEQLPSTLPTDRRGSMSTKYAIWDEGDNYIIENYDGEDIRVVPSLPPVPSYKQ
ncbi:hypothetical protein Glove_505g10 [Diversispora epigaea]|uniref:Cation/H+ exchanger transmembrane domain-containing protein n=1 Tax=Diversispora epigaea TaxID=1348612 RepID=A0A397GKW6_9GLOM|nr:hypothetical protein Glove_505g10 [Diversispora epigaea]